MSVSALVGEIEGVRRSTRRAAAAGAVPLALLGLLVCGAAPFFAAAFHSSNFRVEDGGFFGEHTFFVPPPSMLDRLLRVHPMNVNDSRALGFYWLVGVPVALAAIAAYYVLRARRTGISLDGWRVAAAGAVMFGQLVLTMAFGSFALRDTGTEGLHPAHFLNPLLVVAVGVFAVAWVERSVGVLVAGLGFAGLVVLADVFVYNPHVGHSFPWEFWTGWGWATVILGGWLLVSAGALGLAHRVRRA